MLNYGSNLVGSNPWDKNEDNDVSFNELDYCFPTVMVELTDKEVKECEDAGFVINNNHIDYGAYQEYKYDNKDITASLDTNKDGVVSDAEVLKSFMPQYNEEIKNNALMDYLMMRNNLGLK